jgi:hypothetical protein
MSLVGGLLGSSTLQTLILVGILALAGIRTFRKATGQPLLLDDATFETVKNALTDFANGLSPGNPGPSDQQSNR